MWSSSHTIFRRSPAIRGRTSGFCSTLLVPLPLAPLSVSNGSFMFSMVQQLKVALLFRCCRGVGLQSANHMSAARRVPIDGVALHTRTRARSFARCASTNSRCPNCLMRLATRPGRGQESRRGRAGGNHDRVYGRAGFDTAALWSLARSFALRASGDNRTAFCARSLRTRMDWLDDCRLLVPRGGLRSECVLIGGSTAGCRMRRGFESARRLSPCNT